MEGNESKNIKELIIKKANNIMEEKSIKIGERNMQEIGRQLLIQILDQQWKNHLLDLDYIVRHQVQLFDYFETIVLMS